MVFVKVLQRNSHSEAHSQSAEWLQKTRRSARLFCKYVGTFSANEKIYSRKNPAYFSYLIIFFVKMRLIFLGISWITCLHRRRVNEPYEVGYPCGTLIARNDD